MKDDNLVVEPSVDPVGVVVDPAVDPVHVVVEPAVDHVRVRNRPRKLPILRRKLERIILMKLKKRVVGPGATVDEPIELD